MDGDQFLGLSVVAGLVLALAGLALSLQLHNPLVTGRPRALATLGIVAGAVFGACLAGIRGTAKTTTYW